MKTIDPEKYIDTHQLSEFILPTYNRFTEFMRKAELTRYHPKFFCKFWAQCQADLYYIAFGILPIHRFFAWDSRDSHYSCAWVHPNTYSQ